jgi:hypothetical protein
MAVHGLPKTQKCIQDVVLHIINIQTRLAEAGQLLCWPFAEIDEVSWVVAVDLPATESSDLHTVCEDPVRREHG